MGEGHKGGQGGVCGKFVRREKNARCHFQACGRLYGWDSFMAGKRESEDSILEIWGICACCKICWTMGGHLHVCRVYKH